MSILDRPLWDRHREGQAGESTENRHRGNSQIGTHPDNQALVDRFVPEFSRVSGLAAWQTSERMAGSDAQTKKGRRRVSEVVVQLGTVSLSDGHASWCARSVQQESFTFVDCRFSPLSVCSPRKRVGQEGRAE